MTAVTDTTPLARERYRNTCKMPRRRYEVIEPRRRERYLITRARARYNENFLPRGAGENSRPARTPDRDQTAGRDNLRSIYARQRSPREIHLALGGNDADKV